MEKKLAKGRLGNDRGFSLVELIIVIAILVILSTTATIALIQYIEKSRKTMVLNEARIMYDQCTIAIADLDTVMFKGKEINLSACFNKMDPVYGPCGRLSNWSCYNECGAKSIDKVTTANAYVDQYMSKTIVATLPQFTKSEYGSTSPNGLPMSTIDTDPRFAGKFCFICVYDESGVIYMEVYHKGYFVHFDGNQGINDVINAKHHPEVSFSNVQNASDVSK